MIEYSHSGFLFGASKKPIECIAKYSPTCKPLKDV